MTLMATQKTKTGVHAPQTIANTVHHVPSSCTEKSRLFSVGCVATVVTSLPAVNINHISMLVARISVTV